MNTNSVAFFNNEKVPLISSGHELILAVWEIINPGNIGQIIRLAHNVGATKAIFISERKNYKASKIKKTAGFSFDQMAWEIISANNFFNLLNKDFSLVALETYDGAENIYNQKLPNKMILMAGNESNGIPEEIIARCNLKVYIPMPGNCKSMNISHALTAGAFEWYRQYAEKQ